MRVVTLGMGIEVKWNKQVRLFIMIILSRATISVIPLLLFRYSILGKEKFC